MRKQFKDNETRKNMIIFITALVIAFTVITAVAVDAVGTLHYWMKSEAEAEDWAVTDKGYIRSEFLK